MTTALADTVEEGAADAPPHHEPYDNRRQQRVASTLGMWLFLGTEVLLFGGMFCGYAVYRHLYLDAWKAGSHHLYEWIGVTNTAVLLTSSFTAAMAVRTAKTGSRKGLMISIGLTIFFGAGFLAFKALEYYLDITREHVLPTYNFLAYHGTEPHAAQVSLFLCFYWIMTAIHAFHMTVGLGIWLVLLILAWRSRLPSESSDAVELMGMYWHFVDIVWVFLLPLLYLVR